MASIRLWLYKIPRRIPREVGALVEQSKALHAELTSTDRHKAAAIKAAKTGG